MSPTFDVGYVHVLTEPGGPCVEQCPHPDHRRDEFGRAVDGRTVVETIKASEMDE